MQNGVEGNVRAVFRTGVVLVLREDGTVEIEAGEEALGAGVGEELGVELPVSPRLGVAAHRAGRCSSVGAELDFVLEHVLQAILIHRNQHQVSGLTADLPAKAATLKLDE